VKIYQLLFFKWSAKAFIDSNEAKSHCTHSTFLLNVSLTISSLAFEHFFASLQANITRAPSKIERKRLIRLNTCSNACCSCASQTSCSHKQMAKVFNEPLFAKFLATSLPMPVLAPVTTAVLPNSFSSPLYTVPEL
jgi:hypothetical protein